MVVLARTLDSAAIKRTGWTRLKGIFVPPCCLDIVQLRRTGQARVGSENPRATRENTTQQNGFATITTATNKHATGNPARQATPPHRPHAGTHRLSQQHQALSSCCTRRPPRKPVNAGHEAEACEHLSRICESDHARDVIVRLCYTTNAGELVARHRHLPRRLTPMPCAAT